MEEPWFDSEQIIKKSMDCYKMTFWIKAVIHNWDALTEMLKTEKGMSQVDVDKIKKLSNFLEITHRLPIEVSKVAITRSIKWD